ncbi:MAG TPA: nicotinate phosphoribosyltransferase [Thermoanaerobaculia bacterium]|nr:nicotinate phosphoribosyltransferase [Thermoanaerobaculia bacterium]
MGILDRVYKDSLSLLTDLYQITMAYAHWKTGGADKEAVFHLFYRKNPFGGGFAVACGLELAIEYIRNLRFPEEDLEYLATLRGNDGAPLFEAGFLDYLRDLSFCCDVDAIPEGTVVFPNEPLLRTRGPIVVCQLLETPLLNLINFQTLVATKAARLRLAAGEDHVSDFGLRRAQGIDGGLSASRAAYAGGCDSTSNLLAGKLFGIPVKGTHAHSWVLSFDTELEAFETYAEAMPNNCVFLVDTYNTLEGVRHAVEVGKKLRARGHGMVGIRLDSGDLAYLSREARKILDEGGFPEAAILASNDLDENLIASLKQQQGAKITTWGVGTRLVVAHGDPALGGVYKLTAVREPGGPWEYRLKLSEQAAKTTNPGIQQVRRFTANGEPIGDMIYDEPTGIPHDPVMVDPLDLTRRKTIPAGAEHTDLLVPVFRQGAQVYDPPPLAEVRQRTQDQLAPFHGGIKSFVNPRQSPVGLELQYYDLKMRLILEARGLEPVVPIPLPSGERS